MPISISSGCADLSPETGRNQLPEKQRLARPCRRGRALGLAPPSKREQACPSQIPFNRGAVEQSL